MSHGFNKSKNDEQLLDRISSLPDEVLGHILSFVPTQSAVATSILSTRWKSLYQLTTCLDFHDWYPTFDGKEENARSINFKKSVYLFLALHQKSPIVKFRLLCEKNHGRSHFNLWISAAILKDVQELYFELGVVDFREDPLWLPYSLFNSNSLKVLEIDAKYEFEAPKTVCLPSLKVLRLRGIEFVDIEAFERFMCGCTALEVLTLNSCDFGDARIAYIHSSTLTHLTIKHFYWTERIKIDAPNLSHVEFEYDCIIVLLQGPLPASPYRILTHKSAVTYLSLPQRTLEFVFLLPTIPRLYPNLARLELGWCSDSKRWEELVCVMCRLPRLETIIFRQGLNEKMTRLQAFDDEHELIHLAQFLESLASGNERSKHLATIEVHCFSGHEREFLLLEHLLQIAKDLKRLVLYKSSNMKMKQELCMAKKLLKLPRTTSDHYRVELI